MLSIDEAFKKFKSNLELTQSEQDDASRRHYDVRDTIKAAFSVDRDFLTGSYGRHTKTKPLKDIDVFFVLNKEKEGKYLDEPSRNLLEAFRKTLAAKYGSSNVSVGRRSVTVEFIKNENDANERIMSIDAVPAFENGTNYKIADPQIAANWILSDPEVHAEKSTTANKSYSLEWKPLVKMLKNWNNNHGKPIKPSFLIEVMALDILFPPFSGGYVYELKSFFATAADRIHEKWKDPAGLGPPVSDQMDTQMCNTAIVKLRAAGKSVDDAIQANKRGNTGEALRIWRERVFGKPFPLS